MIIEISITKSLAKYLKLDNLPINDESVPGFSTFYADIITKNRQQTVLFFNTQNSWTTIAYLKDFRKNMINGFKSAIKETLISEGIKEYIIDNYLNDITDIKISLTSSRSIVARMTARKKDIHFFYEKYYDAPDAKTLHNDREFNSWICRNPYEDNLYSYIVPYEEMGYILNKYYLDDKIEEKDHHEYLRYKDEYYPYYSSPLDLSKKSDEEIKLLNHSLNKNNSYIISIPLIRKFYESHAHPILEDYFDFVYSQFHLASINGIKEERCYCRIFALDERILQLYKRFHSRTYKSQIYKK